MTANQGPGVPVELLRELIGRACWNQTVSSRYNAPWDEQPEDGITRMSYREVADAILAEIAASGYQIVASDRLDRLLAGSGLTREDIAQDVVSGGAS